MDSTKFYIVVFLVCIVIIFLPKEIAVAMIAGAALITYVFNYKWEKIGDESEHSPYGNITISDIDSLEQTKPNIVGSDVLDNSDEVNNYIYKGPHAHIPHESDFLNSHGFNQVPLTDGMDLDQALAHKKIHTDSINKRALDGRVRTTKKLYEKYFIDELNEQENREWWSAESSPIETDYNAYQ